MSKLLTLVGRLVAGLLPRRAVRSAHPAARSPVDRVLHHREHLFGCAVQLLDDEAAAQQLVLEALTQAVSGPLLPGVESARSLAAAEPVDAASEQRLAGFLDRLVVQLAVTRLKALSVVTVSRSSRHDHDLEHEGWSSGRTSDSGAGLMDPPGKSAPLGGFAGPSFSAGGADSGSGIRSSTVSGQLPSAVSGGDSGAAFALPGEPAQLQRTAHVLSQLPTETRVTLMLVVMQGRGLPEVAELLGCSEGTCRFWLAHGLKVMRRALQRDLLEDDFISQKARLLMSPGAYNDLRRSKKAAARA